MTTIVLSLFVTVALAADGNSDGCEDSWFDANGACVAPTASVGSGTTIGATATVDPYVAIGNDVGLGSGTYVGGRSTIVGRVAAVGLRPIGDGTVIGRRAFIDADHNIGTGNTFSRGVDIGERFQTAAGVTLGYATEVGNDVSIGASSTLGALVHVGNNTTIAAGTTLARGVDIADSSSSASIGGIIGPDVDIGGNSSISDGARIRKQAQLGAGVTVHDGVRIGRGAIIEDGATIGLNARVGAGATITSTTTVPAGTVVARGDTLDDPAVGNCVVPWSHVQGHDGTSDGIGADTVYSQSGSHKNWNSVVLTYDFDGDFEVVASWYADHIGLGVVHGPGVTYQDVDGYGATNGTYWSSLGVTGFPSGYFGSFKGHYSVNGNSDSAIRYFRWLRQGATLSIQTSMTGPSGPWSHINGSPYSVPATDDVVVGIGEGAGNNDNEGDPLRLLSCTAQ